MNETDQKTIDSLNAGIKALPMLHKVVHDLLDHYFASGVEGDKEQELLEDASDALKAAECFNPLMDKTLHVDLLDRPNDDHGTGYTSIIYIDHPLDAPEAAQHPLAQLHELTGAIAGLCSETEAGHAYEPGVVLAALTDVLAEQQKTDVARLKQEGV